MTGETKRRKEGVEEGWQEETGRREKEGGVKKREEGDDKEVKEEGDEEGE